MDSEESGGQVEDADLYPECSLFSNLRMGSIVIRRRPALHGLISKAKRISDDFVTLGESKAASHEADLRSSTVVHDIRKPVSIWFCINTYDSRGQVCAARFVRSHGEPCICCEPCIT
mgnify:CR=1 FL=1